MNIQIYYYKEFHMRKKRGQNQGSVYQRSSDKRWVGQVTIQKKHHVKYFYSQPEAEAWLSQALLLIGQGLPLAGTRVSLATYFTSWLERLSPSLRPKTQIQYEQVVHKHILPSLGHLSMQELKADHIQELYRLKRQAGCGQRTLTHQWHLIMPWRMPLNMDSFSVIQLEKSLKSDSLTMSKKF
jgi:hypothetical protein